MPATQRGQVYKLGSGRYGIRYYGPDGKRRKQSPFRSRSAAFAWFREQIEPQLRGETPTRDITLAELVETYLERHAVGVRPRTTATLRDRLSHAVRAFGDEKLSELARMSDEIAGWQAQLPPRAGHGIAQALRQVLDAAVRWGYLPHNPAKLAGPNPKPPPRPVRAFTRAEVDAIAIELPPMHQPLPPFATATGLRPEEWIALERRDIDREGGVITIARTVSSGNVVPLAKTSGSRRKVPLTVRALQALDELPPRIDTPLLFPAPGGGLLNIDNFRRREWAPAVELAGIAKPARIYDMRSTFASNALAARIDPFELAKVMGTSIEMIERHYGALIGGAIAGIAGRLDAFEAAQDRRADETTKR